MVVRWDDELQPLIGDNKKVTITISFKKVEGESHLGARSDCRAKTCKKELWQKIQVQNQQAHESAGGQIGGAGGTVGGMP